MTDKLPEWVEDWISERSFYRRLTPAGVPAVFGDVVSVDDLRVFLAQFVLCEREPGAWRWYTPRAGLWDEHVTVGIPPLGNAHMLEPLHAPAKGLPESTATQEQTP